MYKTNKRIGKTKHTKMMRRGKGIKKYTPTCVTETTALR